MATKTRKKTTRKRKPSAKRPATRPAKRKVKATEDGALVGAVRPAGREKYAGAGSRGTKYQPVIDSVKVLKKGESFPLTAPKGTTAKQLQNRLGMILDRAVKSGEIKIPAGCRLSKRTIAGTETIEIAILPAE